MESITDQISTNLGNLTYFVPELILVGGLLCLIVVDLLKKTKLLLPSSLMLIVVVIIALVQQAGGLDVSISLFASFIRLDGASVAWRLLLQCSTAIVIFIAIRDDALRCKGEFYTLIFGILLGAHLLVLSSHLLMVYLGIEIMSICAYALTLFHFNKIGSEASVKYLVFGAVSSALMLFGISWVFTLTGSLNFLEPEFSNSLLDASIEPLLIGLTLILAGILFKIGAVPFHLWAPDVYTAAPTTLVAFFSTVPKIAGLAFLMKWVLVINLFSLGPVDWITILAFLAMASLLVGNFSALRQQNVKRMMAYSSIAHTGFLIIPIVSLSEQASRNLFFYAVIYIFMNLGVFFIIHFFESREEALKISDYRGMIKKYPLLSVLMVVLMISLVGLPPTAGFTAKLLIFSSIWESYAANGNKWLLLLFAFGLINTVTALFYYLKIPFYMIFRIKQDEETAVAIKSPLYENYFAMLLVFALLALFFKPDWLLSVVNKITFAF